MITKKVKTQLLVILYIMFIATLTVGFISLGVTNKVSAATQSATFLTNASDPTVSSVTDYKLTKVGTSAYDASKQAFYFDQDSAVYAAARSGDGYDFMDDFVGTDFTVSTVFMLPKTLPSGQEADGRGVIFSLWGLWDCFAYGGDAAANLMASSLVYDEYASGATSATVRFAFLYDDSGSPNNGWHSKYTATITTDEFHKLMFTVSSTYHIEAYLDGTLLCSMDCSSQQVFKSGHMQFSLGGAHGDGGFSGGSSGTPNKTGSCLYMRSFEIKNSCLSASALQTQSVVSYTASSITQSATFLSNTTDPTISSVSEYNLTKVGTSSYIDAQQAFYFDQDSAVYATPRSDGYDFMDDFAGTNFTVSTVFMLPKTLPSGQEADGRGVIFSLWGLWEGYAYGTNNFAANLLSSSLIYDQYSSGATSATIRFGFLYDNASNADTGTENGWHSKYNATISTDVFHKLMFSVTSNYHIEAYLDGTLLCSMDCSTKQTFRNGHMQFSLGGAHGDAGFSGGSTGTPNKTGSCLYMRSFELINSCMSTNDLQTQSVVSSPSTPSTPTTPTTPTGTVQSATFLHNTADPTKSSVSEYNLTKFGTCNYDATKEAFYLDRNSALYAAAGSTGYDFADDFVGNDFTISTVFMLPKNVPSGQEADNRGIIFTLWGAYWSSGSYNGADADLMSSALVYDAYASGSSTALIRLGFLYESSNGTTTNAWNSNKNVSITTDVFHKFVITISKDLHIEGYLDGQSIWSMDCSNKQMFRSPNVQFTLGGYHGTNGFSGQPNYGTGSSLYMRSFEIINSVLSTNEAKTLSYIAIPDPEMPTVPSSADLPSQITDTSGAFISYPFNDSGNVGKSNRGGIFDLQAYGGTPTVSNGVVTTNGAVLAAKRDSSGYDYLDYLNEYTMTFSFYLPSGTARSHSVLATMYGIGDMASINTIVKEDAGCIMVREYDASASSATVVLGFNKAGEYVDNWFPCWASTTLSVSLGEWHTMSLSYSKSASTINASIDGITFDTIDLNTTIYKNSKVGFGIGGCLEFDSEGSTKIDTGLSISTQFKDLRIYSFVLDSASLQTMSANGGTLSGITVPSKVTGIKTAVTYGIKATNQPTPYTALCELIENGKKARVSLDDGSSVNAEVFWYTAKENADGSASVYGIIVGAHNPDGIGVIANVGIASYKVTFKGSNFDAKVDGVKVTSVNVAYGDVLEFTITPKTSYAIESIKMGKNELTAVNGVYTVSGIEGPLSIVIKMKSTAVDTLPKRRN